MPDVIVFKPTKQPPRCRNCSYRLEGLTEPRCPECGRGFEPADPRTYSEEFLEMPPWDGPRWFLGWLAALAMSLAISGCFVMMLERDFRGVDPLWFLILSLPTAGTIRIGFNCRLVKTIAWSGGIMVGAIGVGVIASGFARELLEVLVATFFMAMLVVAILLSLGHAFRRWGPFEWFPSTRYQSH
jgi:hypothetical protein